jgi:hypothetical protein
MLLNSIIIKTFELNLLKWWNENEESLSIVDVLIKQLKKIST